MTSVPFFDYPGVFQPRQYDLVAVFLDVLERGAYIMQRDLNDFERSIAGYLGVKHAFGVGNATDGLIMAWRAMGLKPGDEVIFPSHTMVASPASVHFAGGVPVPIDCDADHLMDPEAIEAAITPRTRAIMPVQLNGRTSDMDRITAVAEKHGLAIVEDSAQALGSKFKGRMAGTFGKAGVFSFYPAKILGCMGDGGMVVTDDDQMADKLFLLRDHGRDRQGEVQIWGMNSRLDNLQAAILHMQFREYQRTIERRREIAGLYQKRLGDLQQLVLPPAPGSDPDHFDVFQNYEVEANGRDELKLYLEENGIGTMVQWGGKAVHQFEKLGFEVTLPATERLFERCLMLPINMSISNDQVKYVCEKIRRFYAR
jgi:dTDP-4-amino-4,6-dideoxygalactose transaminase